MAGPSHLLVLLAAGLSLAACSITAGRLPMVSTRALAYAPAVRPATGLGTPAIARSCVWIATLFPVTPLPSVGQAVERALAATGADALWDVTIRYEISYLPPLGGRTCYVVEGRAS
jgi:hypothetical protein